MEKDEKKSWDVISIITGFILILLLLSIISSCTVTKYVPTEAVHKIEYRDSIIRIVDTVRVEIPKEKVVEVLPEIDTSYLEIKTARSTAFLDRSSKTIRHTLESKQNSLKAAIDTVVVIQTKTEYVEKPVIETVEVEKLYIPTWAWIVMCYAALMAGITIYKIVGKFR